MNPLRGYPPLADTPKLLPHDRVRVPGKRTGEVIGFYRNEQDLVLVRLEDGERRRYSRTHLRLLIG